jgi:integral membrane sensor domain MASE1
MTALRPADLPRPSVLAVFAVGYFLGVRLGEHAYGSLAVPSPFWLPVFLCALLLTPRSQWWVFALAIWPIRILVGAAPGTPMWFQLVSIANDTAKGLAAAWLLERFAGRPLRLRNFHEFLLFLGIAAAALPAVSALAAAPARYALGDPLWRAAYQWFLGDALTQVVVTPTLLYWCRRDFGTRVRLAELLPVAVCVAGALFVGLGVDHFSYSLMFVYLPIPFLIWAAVRLGPFGTANSLTLVAIVSMVAAVEGMGVFAGQTASNAVLSIQLFPLVVAASLLSLAILVVEREALRAREATLTTG